MKKYSVYDDEKKLDRAWFDSTNAIYGECQDNPNELKTVKIDFKTSENPFEGRKTQIDERVAARKRRYVQKFKKAAKKYKS